MDEFYDVTILAERLRPLKDKESEDQFRDRS
jgi:hypothetical protein